MAIDLNSLPLEAPQDQPQVDFANYADPSDIPPPVAEGTYNFKTVKAEVEKFENGVITVLYDHELYDPATGTKVGALNFDRVSTKVFNRNNIPVSMAADQLRAIGVTERPSSPRQWAEQLLAVKTWCDQGQFWNGVTKWDGYCAHKDTQYAPQLGADNKPLPQQTVPHALPFAPRGMKKWPLASGANGSGAHDHEMPCPTCGQNVAARNRVDRRVPR